MAVFVADYYFDPIGGDNANAGTTTALPKKNWANMVALCGQGITIGVKNTEVFAATVEFNGTNATQANPCIIVGLNSSWEEDGTVAVVDCNSACTPGIKVSRVAYQFRNIEVKNATNTNWDINSSFLYFRNCLTTSSAFEGAFGRLITDANLVEFSAVNNTTYGFSLKTGVTYNVSRCFATGSSVGFRRVTNLIDSVSHNNTNYAVQDITTSGERLCFRHCTIWYL